MFHRLYGSEAVVTERTKITLDESEIPRQWYNVIPDLPGSVIDTLRPGASTRRADTYKRAARFVVPMHGVLTGKQEITVRVRDENK